MENLKHSCSDETLTADEKCKESEARVEDNNSVTLVNQRFSEPPIGVPENGTNLALRMTEVRLHKKGTSDRSVDEMASTSCCQESVIVFNKNSADKDLFNLSVIIQLQVGIFFASENVATILIGLHMSETSSRFSFNKVTERKIVNPITWRDCICPTHKPFGIKFEAQMSCGCGKCSAGCLYAIPFHKLDAGSPQTTKIKSFADLPVLLDEQCCKENNCKDCGNLQTIDLHLSNTPHFITIGGNESQDTLSEVMAGLTSPLETKLFCRSAHSATMYTVTSRVIKKGGESNELSGIG